MIEKLIEHSKQFERRYYIEIEEYEADLRPYRFSSYPIAEHSIRGYTLREVSEKVSPTETYNELIASESFRSLDEAKAFLNIMIPEFGRRYDLSLKGIALPKVCFQSGGDEIDDAWFIIHKDLRIIIVAEPNKILLLAMWLVEDND